MRKHTLFTKTHSVQNPVLGKVVYTERCPGFYFSQERLVDLCYLSYAQAIVRPSSTGRLWALSADNKN